MKDNAWFVGWAPCYKPEIVVAVLWENVGVHGQFAAPIARDVMKAYFDKKDRLAEAEAAREKRNPATSLVSAILPVIKTAQTDKPGRLKFTDMFQFAGIKDFDWTMFFVSMIICGLGVLQIFSATHDTVWQGSWWKQMVYIAAGILLMWIATNIDYHALMTQSWLLYFASIVLLIAVLIIGKRAFGSTRWIALPAGIHLQVSEFAKIAIILLVARFLTELRTDVLERRDLLKLAGVIVLPMALIAKEPDLGTALTYLPILAIGVFLAGMPWKYWLAIGVVARLLCPSVSSRCRAIKKPAS